jgi:predicted CopG family antitoxin
MADVTTIEVSTETWKELNQRKEPGDSFDDVIQRMLDE